MSLQTPIINSREVARYLNLQHHGPSMKVERPSSVVSPEPFSITFALAGRLEIGQSLEGAVSVTVITDLEPSLFPDLAVISSNRPRLDFARMLRQFFNENSPVGIHPTAVIDQSVQIGKRVHVGPHAVLDAGVAISDDVSIGANTVIERRTVIGPRTRIGSNSVIGSLGFGFEVDELGVPVRIPHLGAVSIGSDVEIGSSVVIARGTLENTRVFDCAKIDDHVFIAHNVTVGSCCLVIAGAEVSGSVWIGDRSWIGPQATIREQLKIGADSLVGIGAVVVADVPPNTVVAGNPARVMRQKDAQG